MRAQRESEVASSDGNYPGKGHQSDRGQRRPEGPVQSGPAQVARLLEAELDDDDGEFIYEIELLTGDGVVRELEIDARTGRVLEDEVDD